MASKQPTVSSFVPKVARGSTSGLVKQSLNPVTVKEKCQSISPIKSSVIENKNDPSNDGWEDMDDFAESLTQKRRNSIKKDVINLVEESNKAIDQKNNFKKKTEKFFSVSPSKKIVKIKSDSIKEGCIEEKSLCDKSDSIISEKKSIRDNDTSENLVLWLKEQPPLLPVTSQMSEYDLQSTVNRLKQYSIDIREKVFNWFINLPQEVAEKLTSFSDSKISPLHFKLRDKHIQAKIKQAESFLKKKKSNSQSCSQSSISEVSPSSSFTTLTELIVKEHEIGDSNDCVETCLSPKGSLESDSFIISSQNLDNTINKSVSKKLFDNTLNSINDENSYTSDRLVEDSKKKESNDEVQKKPTTFPFVPKTPKLSLNSSFISNGNDSDLTGSVSESNNFINSVNNSDKILTNRFLNKFSSSDNNKSVNSVISIGSSNNSVIDISSSNNSSSTFSKNPSSSFTPEVRATAMLEKLKPSANDFKSVSSYINYSNRINNSGYDSPPVSSNFSTPKTNTFDKSLPGLLPVSQQSTPFSGSSSKGGESFSDFFPPPSRRKPSSCETFSPRDYQMGPETENIVSDMVEDDELKKSNFDHKTSPYKKDNSIEFQRQDYPHCKEMFRVFRHTFGLHRFRPNQMEAINAAMLGHDCFILMPTGGGKSICYQLPALLSPGITIVISPLISLIQDQCQKLKSLDIPAAFLSGNTPDSEVGCIYKDLYKIGGPELKLLFVTPEKINGSKKLQDCFDCLYKRNLLARFVIDEAHCVSQWGHDFRPDYKQLCSLRKSYENIPLMALTATATVCVRKDILFQLNMNDPKWFLSSFDRPNLRYEILPKKGKDATLKEIADLIKARFRNQSGIVYCFSRNECQNVANYLSKCNVSATSYHAGLTDNQRRKAQQDWTGDRVKVVCATIAFGMGIDKADVRFVIHYSLPKSIEGYYQEAGRAGRDGEISSCILYYSYKDMHRIHSLILQDASGTRDTKQTHINNLWRMVRFCEDKYHCRRFLQLSYFDEHYDSSKCIADRRTTCDNCLSKGSYTLKDVTNESKRIVECVRQMCNQRSNITLTHVGDILKGLKNQKLLEKGHDKLSIHGLARNWDKCDIPRLLQKLVLDHYLEEFFVTNREGFPNSYVKCGKNSHLLLNGSKQVKLPVKTNSQSKDESSIEQTSNQVNPKIKEIEERCYLALMDVIRATAESLGINTASIFTIQTVRAMSKILPESEAGMLSIDGVTKANFEKYGRPLLEITQQHSAEKLVVCIEEGDEANNQPENNADNDVAWLFNPDAPSSSSHYFGSNSNEGKPQKKTWRKRNTKGRGAKRKRNASPKVKTTAAKKARTGKNSWASQKFSSSSRPGFMANPKAVHIK